MIPLCGHVQWRQSILKHIRKSVVLPFKHKCAKHEIQYNHEKMKTLFLTQKYFHLFFLRFIFIFIFISNLHTSMGLKLTTPDQEWLYQQSQPGAPTFPFMLFCFKFLFKFQLVKIWSNITFRCYNFFN